MSGALPSLLIRRLPFFYGWVILACACCAGFSRQGGAVATLSIFVEPMIRDFGWSRTGLSGAVSLGGVLAALSSPVLGRVLDRRGARLVLCLAVLLTGTADMLLSLTNSLSMFYLLFCVARMNFAGPFDLGIYGAVNNWFVARRALVTSIATVAQMMGLVALPLIAQAAILYDGWRAGWLAVGAAVLVIGFIPNWLLMVRRPEDLGLVPDRRTVPLAATAATRAAEPNFSRAQALRTPSFWLLCLFTLLAYPVQAGVSLHQAPFLIERGLSPTVAATVVSTLLAYVRPLQSRLRFISAVAADPLRARACRLCFERRNICHAGCRLASPRAPGGGNLRHGHRRPFHTAAHRMGRLLWPRELRCDPRHRVVGAGAGTGIRPAAVRNTARPDGQL